MAIDTIKATAILDGSVDTADLADDAVTSAKITDGNITGAKIGDGEVTSAKISGLTGASTGILQADGDGTISTTVISSDSITEGNSSVEVVDTGTGHVAVTVDGSETARFDANGRLGIGTTSPDKKIQVSDATGTNLFRLSGVNNFNFDIESTGTGNQFDFNILSSGGTYTFNNNGGELMRIESNGNVKIGNRNGASANGLDINSSGRMFMTSSVTDFVVEYIELGGSRIGGIATNLGANSVSYNTSSDYRLKENVVDMTDAIDRVKALKPSRFNFISNPNTTVDGFLAHEAQEIVPESVTGEKDEVEAIGNITDAEGVVVQEGVTEPSELPEDQTWTKTGDRPVMQGIDQAKLVPLLTGALQEAIARIETLETTQADLIARIEALEAN